MPRAARKKSESGFYHVLLRGIDKMNIFADDEDRFKFIKTISRYKDELCFEIHAYCLMDNHVHLLIRDVNNQLDLIMKKVEGSYAYYFNWKYERSGHLFQDRFKSEPVDDDTYFLTVLRYILKNPEKAGICTANNYRWSSYYEYINVASITDTEFAMSFFDEKNGFERFIKESVDTVGLDIVSDNRMTDAKAQKAIADKYGENYLSSVSDMPSDDRNSFLIELRKMGLSVRQISRLTGINRGLVQLHGICQGDGSLDK